MSDNKLPALPNADLIVFDGELQGCLEGVKMKNVRAYGQQCYQQALEDAARRFEQVGGMIDPRSIAAAIRALGALP